VKTAATPNPQVQKREECIRLMENLTTEDRKTANQMPLDERLEWLRRRTTL
jgi:hypothetical protein